MRDLLVATRNPGKAREFAHHLAGCGVRVVGLFDRPELPEPAEDGVDFAANARQKALHFHHLTGLPTLADDSGLAVDHLGGAPGVHSARWAGPDANDAARIAKLLAALRGVPETARGGRFVCALAVAAAGQVVFEVVGECAGRILTTPQGQGGFGYDPVFWLPELDRTFAELTATEKQAVSHRGRALAALRPHLAALLPPT